MWPGVLAWGMDHNIIDELLVQTFLRRGREVVVTDESGAGALSGSFGKYGFVNAVAFLVTLWLLSPPVFLFHPLSLPLSERGEPFLAQPSLQIIPDSFADSKAFKPPPLFQTL